MSAGKRLDIAEEDQWRMLTYRLLARLLAAAPDQSVLDQLQAVDIQKPETDLSKAWHTLGKTAAQTKLTQVEQEYNALFIGFCSGEVVPYASRYRTGFLMEKPLARLRQDLIEYNIQRQHSVYEPEDHIAAVFEAMSLLIESGGRQQWTFFSRHIQPWSYALFTDLQHAASAQFYLPVSQLGRAFIELETTLSTIEHNSWN